MMKDKNKLELPNEIWNSIPCWHNYIFYVWTSEHFCSSVHEPTIRGQANDAHWLGAECSLKLPEGLVTLPEGLDFEVVKYSAIFKRPKIEVVKNHDIESILFARWLAVCYADDHLDKDSKHSSDVGFKGEFLSILNMKDSTWYKEQLDHFNSVVLPNQIANGVYQQHIDYLIKN